MRLTFSYRGALVTLNSRYTGPNIGKGGKQKVKPKGEAGGGGGGQKRQISGLRIIVHSLQEKWS